MVDPTTTNRTLAVPTRGSDVGTWDVPVNNNMALLDTIVGGVTSISSTGGTTTLNATQLAGGTISVSGALVSNVTLLFPAVQGWWSIENLTTNNGSFTVLVASGTGAVVIGMPSGTITDVQINGNTPKYRNIAPLGTYLDVASATVPSWVSQSTVPPYLNCDGSTFSGVTYPFLSAYLNGTTLPDFKGSGAFYANQGSGRLTSAGAGIDGNSLFSAGGNNGVTLVSNQVPALSGSNNISVVLNGASSANGVPVTPTPGNINAGNRTNGSGPTDVVSTSASWGGASATSSGSNNITVNPTGATNPIQSITRGVVAGIRMIRAA